jgi:hypothetical protein
LQCHVQRMYRRSAAAAIYRCTIVPHFDVRSSPRASRLQVSSIKFFVLVLKPDMVLRFYGKIFVLRQAVGLVGCREFRSFFTVYSPHENRIVCCPCRCCLMELEVHHRVHTTLPLIM